MKKSLLLFTLFATLLSCASKETQRVTLTGRVFGTTYKIVHFQKDLQLQDAIEDLFEQTNRSVSTYIPNSIISQINKGDTKIQLDTIFTEVFEKSIHIFKETEGYFDPTVGNLVNAYGFGPAKTKIDLTQKQIDSMMQFVGFDKVKMMDGRIVKEDPKIYLDFNSIAKGFGIDIVARFFDAKGLNNYLIEIGGEIRTKGNKEEGKPWVIQVVDPVDADNSGGFKKINLSNKSMATSGNYRKFRVAENGTKYVHTINPLTGLAKESNLLSASVISYGDCADVDAYATAFMAMGLDKTKQFLQRNPNKLEVILIYVDENNQINSYSNRKEQE